MPKTPPSPRWPYPRVPLDALLMSGALIAVMVLASRCLNSNSLTAENGWLEGTQSFQLFAAAICGALASVYANTRMWRCIAVVLASVAAVGLAREFPSLEVMKLDADLPSVGLAIPRWSKRVIYAFAVLSAFAGTLLMFIRERRTMFHHLGPRFIWPGVIFASCFAFAKLFERQHLVFLEEAIEIYAYSLLVLVNVYILRTSQDEQTVPAFGWTDSNAAIMPLMMSDHRPNMLDQPIEEPLRVNKIRVLGNGRAATAELVEAVWADGRRTKCVEKVFAPGLLTKVIYRIAFAAPFAYRSNRHAILTCFYRRRVIASWLKRQGSAVRVAAPLYVRFDRPRRAWVLAAEWIEGRGPIIKTNQSDEMGALVTQMNQLESGLIEAGLYGSGWQVSPRALVSTANLMIVDRPQLSIHYGDEHKTQVVKRESDTVIIDLESGIPAVLVFRYLLLAWKQGSVFPFDDLDEKRLRQTVGAMGQDPADELQHDLDSLARHSRLWKDTELALFRKPWRWFSKQRRSLYREESIRQWKLERVIDPGTEAHLTQHPMLWLAFCLLGAIPAIGRITQRFFGNRRLRAQMGRLLTHSRYRHSVLHLYRCRTTQKWIAQSRISRRSSHSMIQFIAHRVLSKGSSAHWHRWMCDRQRRQLSRRKSIATLTSRAYQSKIACRVFHRMVGQWESRRWIDSVDAAQLKDDFDHPNVGIYSRGLAKHLAIKTLTPLASMLKVTGMAAVFAGGSYWYAAVPFLILPLMRSVVTLQSWWVSRQTQIPHLQALAFGVIPTLGSFAFVLQMFNSNPTVAEFILRDTASRIGRHLPIYGGADSRTEHAMVTGMGQAIRWARKLSPHPPSFPSSGTHTPEKICPAVVTGSDRKAA